MEECKNPSNHRRLKLSWKTSDERDIRSGFRRLPGNFVQMMRLVEVCHCISVTAWNWNCGRGKWHCRHWESHWRKTAQQPLHHPIPGAKINANVELTVLVRAGVLDTKSPPMSLIATLSVRVRFFDEPRLASITTSPFWTAISIRRLVSSSRMI
jgi:hypothetical protein